MATGSGSHQTEIYVGSDGRIAPTSARGCGYPGSSPSSGSGSYGGGEVVTASGDGDTALIAGML